MTAVSATVPGPFTFAKGNAAKLAAVPRYATGGLRTRFRNRDAHLWAFGSAFGLAEKLSRVRERAGIGKGATVVSKDEIRRALGR